MSDQSENELDFFYVKDNRATIREIFKKSKEIKNKIQYIASDFLINESVEEFKESILKLNIKENREEIAKMPISLSFDRNERERKLIANLMIQLVFDKFITQEDLGLAMSILLSRLSDLMLDIPKVVSYLEFYSNRFIESKVLEYRHSKTFLDLLSIYSGSSTKETLKKIVKKIFENYFVTGQLEEAIKDVAEIEDPPCHPLIVKYCISFSFDRGRHERELVSRFLARVVEDNSQSSFITKKSLEEGFKTILNCVEDLYEDVPYVYQYLAFFIGRAIHDEAVAPAFIYKVRPHVSADAHIVLENVEKLLKMPNRAEEFERLWDSKFEELPDLKAIVKQNVVAFFDRDGCDKKFRSFLVEMEHPHFHYEVVKQLFSTLIDRDDRFISKVGALINSLYQTGITARSEIEKGLKTIEKLLPEYTIDAPKAPQIFAELKKQIVF